MTFDLIINRLQRVMMLDEAAFREVRDDTRFTPVCVAVAGIAALLAGIGAWLYGVAVIDGPTPEGWFTDTVVLGTLFAIILFLAGVGITYILLTQVFHADVAPDAVVRIVTLAHLPYALGLLVFIQEIGFGFGLLSVVGTFFYTFYGLRAAAPQTSPMAVLISVLAGFSLWAFVIPVISDPGDNFVTGVFVYGLIA